MTELQQLGRALRSELGTPPDDWERRQALRLRSIEVTPRSRTHAWLAPALASLVLLAMVMSGWLYLSPAHEPATDASVWLFAEALTEPYRLNDGSSIALGPGARGRLELTDAATRFDLHQGIGHFEVTKKDDQHWTVVAGQYEVHVVGTRFSVAYESPGQLSVWVERGSVAVQLPSQAAPVRLQVGDRLTATGSEFALEHAKSDLAPASTATPAPASQPGEPGPAVPSGRANDPSDDWHALYRKGQYTAAFAAAEQLGLNQLLNGLNASMLADLADAARLSGQSDPALRALEALERRFPSTPLAADAGFLIGRILATRGDPDAAIARFKAYLSRGEQARYSVEAIGRLIELYSTQGNAHEAGVMAERYLQRAPHGPYRRLAQAILQQR